MKESSPKAPSGVTSTVEFPARRPRMLIVVVLFWLAWLAFLGWMAWNRAPQVSEPAAGLPASGKAATIVGLPMISQARS